MLLAVPMVTSLLSVTITSTCEKINISPRIIINATLMVKLLNIQAVDIQFIVIAMDGSSKMVTTGQNTRVVRNVAPEMAK